MLTALLASAYCIALLVAAVGGWIVGRPNTQAADRDGGTGNGDHRAGSDRTPAARPTAATSWAGLPRRSTSCSIVSPAS